MISASGKPVSFRSRACLNATNFFVAEMGGTVVPFLEAYLREKNWRYDKIGIPIALAGLGVFLTQTIAGMTIDRTAQRRVLFVATLLGFGVCYALLPLLPPIEGVINPLLFASGLVSSFFAPLLSALALGLVGHERLNQAIGENHAWNHAGNIAAAATAMALVNWLSLASVFFATMLTSVAAATCVLLIRERELNEAEATGAVAAPVSHVSLKSLLRERTVRILLAAAALFNLASAPVMPMAGLYIKHLGGTNTHIAAVVLVGQAVMVPTALLGGYLCGKWGRKPVFIVGFLSLPLRILLLSMTTDPRLVVALQVLDGVGGGIYGVASVAMCSDITYGKGGFNTLMGMMGTALSIGGMLGPLISGFSEEYLGFQKAFYVYLAISLLAAAVFILGMPETSSSR